MKQGTAFLLALFFFAVACGLFAQSASVKSAADISKAGMDPERPARIPSCLAATATDSRALPEP